ncbi:hypothetical protein Rhopal_004548-T1 [Rhodotorula paludigena]|uniref:DUF7918 domain-containing protein n=1 Tax=Rhodotorula paludigena TaxID=86838 RepID=A0AAV5GNR2_9BASI|nr:hypothetical protein Rhopal_004548-T1 [Rhodotorula paludigena]
MAGEVIHKLTDEKQRWSAWVTVDGRSLETYKVQRSATKTTCFIESAEEQTFQVVVKNENYPQTFAADLYVDGLRIDGYSIRKVGKVDTYAGKRISSTEIRPCKFAKVALTDDSEQVTADERFSKEVGTITLRICRTQYKGTKTVGTGWQDDAQQRVLDERSKKGSQVSHATTYDKPQYKPTAGVDELVYLDPHDAPFHVFEFHYRSRDLLELAGLLLSASAEATVGASSNVIPPRRKRAATHLAEPHFDKDALLAELRKLQSENEALKAGRKVEYDEPDEKKIKREA